MNRLPILACLGLLALPCSAMALEAGPSSPQQAETEGWLQLQISHQAASPIAQTATATERELAMQRWLRKFNYDIPDLFEQGQEGHIQSSN